MSPLERAEESQAKAWLDKLVDRMFAAAADSEVDHESMRDFGYPRGPCTPRSKAK